MVSVRSNEGCETVAPGHERPGCLTATLPPEIGFLAESVLPPDRLAAVAREAERLGVSAETVLLADGHVTADRYYRSYAAYVGLPYAERPLRPHHEAEVADVISRGLFRLSPNRQGWDWLLAPRGLALRALPEMMARQDRRPGLAITTPDRLEALIRHSRRACVARAASDGLAAANWRLSAKSGLTVGQSAAFAGAAMALCAATVLAFDRCSLVLDALFGLAFLAAVSLRLVATGASRARGSKIAALLPDHALPVYSIIVPLFREARVIRRLVQSLDALDYPRAKLDIILVVEPNDPRTLDAIDGLGLPGCYRTIVAPAGRPQTKPRALNVALQFARGELVVIFDAEDAPEPQQLREAAARFAETPDIACLQARLAIDNFEDGWITRAFALEYAALFHVVNPGLAALGLPIPLGGTSNHFRAAVLREVNGWDAWNVTEDVDLGLRLARLGFHVDSLASTTFEEAPNTLKAWLAQRRRWQKGWMVTLATHSRHPLRFWRDLGLLRGAAASAMLFGTVVSALLGPFFTAAVLLRLWSGELLAPVTTSDRIWSLTTAGLAGLGLTSALWPILVGLHRRGLMRLAGTFVWYPFYLLLLSIASWQAVLEVCGRPYAWSKTEHGRAKRRLTSILPG